MTHTLPISGTQKKEHILMVKKRKRNSAPWCLCSGCVHDWEKESSDLFAELNVYVWTCIKRPFKPESPAAYKLNWSLAVTTCFAIPWNTYQSFLGGEPACPASCSVQWWWSRVTGGIACLVCRSVTLKIHSFQNYREWESQGPKPLKSNSWEMLRTRSPSVAIMNVNERT